jgi:hypothetical protein
MTAATLSRELCSTRPGTFTGLRPPAAGRLGAEAQGLFSSFPQLFGAAMRRKVIWGFDYTDGSSPQGSLILDSAGNLYGTAESGSFGDGVVFEVTP